MSISVAPDGTEYSFPTQEEDKKEFEILKTISEKERKKGRKIVVVQGLGFVGSVMAAVVADAEDKNGEPMYLMILFHDGRIGKFLSSIVANRQ